MNRCPQTEAILEAHAGGRARREVSALLRDHLSGCDLCRSAVADYASVIGQVRAVFQADQGLNDFVRARLARQAAVEAAREPWWRRLVPMGHTPTWAAVAPALLVALVVAFPLAVRRGQAPVAGGEVPVRLDMRATEGAVSLAWSDGNGKAYRVYKSNDPRQLGQGQAEIVKGNHWVDEHPESSQIVFYRVE